MAEPSDDTPPAAGPDQIGPSEIGPRSDPDQLRERLGFDPATLARNPNLRVLLFVVIAVAVVAVVLGFGWP